jgi:hypothetical protein
MNYLQKRLAEFGIREDENNTHVFTGDTNNPKGEFSTRQLEWFSSDKDGNIKILFKTLDNRHLHLHSGDRKTVQPIYRTRYSPEMIKYRSENYDADNKYGQPPGTGNIIFHTPGIINTYLNETQVETLYLVEGEFKAFVASMHSTRFETEKNIERGLWTKKQIEMEPNLPPPNGLPIMGISGITGLYNQDRELHNDIAEYIRVCRPKNVVFIMDADYRAISSKWHPEDNPNMDLARRLKSFYQASISIRSVLKGLVKDTYLVNLKEELLESDEPIKGLDDLLASGLSRPTMILFHLFKVHRPKTRNDFFESLNLSTAIGTAIKKHFLLSYSSGTPKAFYMKHHATLLEHEFRFNGCRYKYNGDELQMTLHGDSESYVRVGPTYFKQIKYPDARGNEILELVKWSKAEIHQDYVVEGYKEFIKSIPKYDRFVVVPENNPDQYQQVLGSCYNMYYPIDVEPRSGEWPTILSYLKHVFSQDKDQLDVALDWISIAWNNPTQKLPAICLVSQEKSTGKSKFLELMKEIFQDNAAIIGNQEITDRFNDDYITKNIIGLNESFIDKKQTIEKIKTWITEPHAQMDTKNISRVRVDMFAKILMTSNNVTDFIRIDDDENRFWVRYVHPFEGEEIPDLLERMSEEIPAFIYYLKNDHVLKYPRRTRLWFHPDVYTTDTLKELQKEGKSQMYKNIKLAIQDLFYKYNMNETQLTKFPRLYLGLKDICELVQGKHGNIDMQYVKKVLKGEFKMTPPERPTSRKHPQEDEMSNGDGIMYKYSPSKPGRYYEFKAVDFLSEEAIEAMNIKDIEGQIDDDELPF